MRFVLLLCVSITFAGCGAADTNVNKDAIANAQKSQRMEASIISALGLTTEDDGISWHFTVPGGTTCSVSVILSDAAEVDLYSSAGDSVITTPDRTAGVKMFDDPECMMFVDETLASMPDPNSH